MVGVGLCFEFRQWAKLPFSYCTSETQITTSLCEIDKKTSPVDSGGEITSV